MCALYDPFDPSVQADPYPVYAELRARHPVYRCEPRSTWVLSRYADVDAAVTDPATYSSAKGIFPTREGLDMTQVFLPMMIMMDPPDHTRLRRLVSSAFTPRRTAALETAVHAIARELLDPFLSAGSGDLVKDFAGPLPAMVIADLLGVDRSDRDQFRTWSSTLVQGDPGEPAAMQASLDAAGSLYGYFTDVIEHRRAHPQQDLVSALVNADMDGQRLTAEELLGFCLLLLVAGHETTTNLITNSAVVLAERPDARAALAAQPAAIPDAVEELLRFDSPVQGLARTLTRDVTLHDVTMAAGDTVLLLFGSANRDSHAFPDADRFDPKRRPERQVAFGHGIHFCLGASLARLEARIALTYMLEFMPDWRCESSSAIRLRSGPIRGYTALPLTWKN